MFEHLCTVMNDDQFTRLAEAVNSAILWRGWDRSGGGVSLPGAHAAGLVNTICAIAAEHGITYEEYT